MSDNEKRDRVRELVRRAENDRGCAHWWSMTCWVDDAITNFHPGNILEAVCPLCDRQCDRLLRGAYCGDCDLTWKARSRKAHHRILIIAVKSGRAPDRYGRPTIVC